MGFMGYFKLVDFIKILMLMMNSMLIPIGLILQIRYFQISSDFMLKMMLKWLGSLAEASSGAREPSSEMPK